MAGTHLSIRIDLASGARIGPGKIALLEAIRSTGSISAAARALAPVRSMSGQARSMVCAMS